MRKTTRICNWLDAPYLNAPTPEAARQDATSLCAICRLSYCSAAEHRRAPPRARRAKAAPFRPRRPQSPSRQDPRTEAEHDAGILRLQDPAGTKTLRSGDASLFTEICQPAVSQRQGWVKHSLWQCLRTADTFSDETIAHNRANGGPPIMTFDAAESLPQGVSDLLTESDPAARAHRWMALRKAHPTDLSRAARSALLHYWVNESAKPEGGAVCGIGIDGPLPTLVWLIPDHQTALECLSDLHVSSPDVAATLVRTVLELTQAAAAFFYTGARVSSYPMAALKTNSERRKVALGADIQRAADDLHIAVPVHLRIRRVEKMNLPCERFGQPPVRPAQPEVRTAMKEASNTSTLRNGPTPQTSKVSLEAPLHHAGISESPAEEPEVFYASQTAGVPGLDFFEMAELTETDEVRYRLWGETNWKDLLSECGGVYVDEEQELDEVPCYSDISYKITIIDRVAFSSSLRKAILNIVSED